jgi:uncharacterized damage-inducible protein DinB
MTPEACRAMARYNRWMNEKVYACAAGLADEERKRDRGAFFRSIHATLNHLLVADRIWLGRIHGATPAEGFLAEGVRSLDQELFADFEKLRAERAKTDAALEAWTATLTADALAGDLRFVRRGTPVEAPLWWVAMHVFNHETHHRGQVTTLLTQAGRDPGVTDLYAMLIAERASVTA